MVSLSGLNTIMNESTDAVMYTGMDYMTESAFDQMINGYNNEYTVIETH